MSHEATAVPSDIAVDGQDLNSIHYRPLPYYRDSLASY